MNKTSDTRPPFFLIEDSVVTDYDLNPFEGWLYVVMVKHADRKTGELFPSVQTLANETHMSKASVIRYTKSLEAKNLIRVDRDINTKGKDREVNHYWLLVATTPVSASNRVGISEQPPPVADVDINKNQLEQESIAPDGAAKPVPAQTINPMKDAIAKAFNYKWETMSKPEKGLVQVTAKELCEAGITPAEVPALYAYCKGRFSNFKPRALSTNVSDWRKSISGNVSVLDGLRLVS